jgi:ABC-2 type transport system permease protein
VRPFLLLFRLRLAEIGRSASSLAIYLGMPLSILAVIGLVFSHGHPFDRRTLLVVGLDAAVAAPLRTLGDLEVRASPSLAQAQAELRTCTAHAILQSGPEGGLALIVGPREVLWARGIQASLGRDVRIQEEPIPQWGYVHYLFPGCLTWLILGTGLYGMGSSMARYRQSLFLKKLATTPLSPLVFIASQIGSRAVVLYGQVAMLFGVAWVAFGLHVTPGALAWSVPIIGLGVLTTMGLGFGLACVIRNEASINDAIGILLTALVFLSEIFFPVDDMPFPLPDVSVALPSTQLARLLRAVLLRGETSAAALLPGMAVMALWAALAFGFSWLKFRWIEE